MEICAPLIAEGGNSLPRTGDFLNTDELYEVLRNQDFEVLESIPVGIKENKFYIYYNEINLTRRKNNMKSRHWDDAGSWVSGPTNCSLFLVDKDEMLKEVKLEDGVYGTIVNKKLANGRRKKIMVPLEPQLPTSRIVKLHRAYSWHALDKSYRWVNY